MGLAALSTVAHAAQPAIFATFEDGNIAQVMPDPSSFLPTPVLTTVTGFPVGAGPHGVAYISDTEALISDFSAPRVFRVSTVTASVLSTIPVPSRTNGSGTVAISPDGNYAITAGSSGTGMTLQGQAAVIRAPFVAAAASSALTLPGIVRGFNTQAIAFAQNGRAFVCHTGGVSVLDPPYTAVTFTIGASRPNGSNCVLRRDDSRLVVTNNQTFGGLAVYDAPFSAGSTPILIPPPAGVGFFGPLGFSPDGTALLVGQQNRPNGSTDARARLFVLRETVGPPGVSWTEIMLPIEITGSTCIGSTTACPGFEDLDLNVAGDLAIVTGNSSTFGTARAPLLVVRNPFDAPNLVTFPVVVGDPNANTHGRGTGSARFLPPGLPMFRDGFED